MSLAPLFIPDTMARLARRIATKDQLGCTILNEKQLERQGYDGLIEVGKGSVHPPRMIILRYKPTRKSSDHLALVGKGITFDTGGLSLKSVGGYGLHERGHGRWRGRPLCDGCHR